MDEDDLEKSKKEKWRSRKKKMTKIQKLNQKKDSDTESSKKAKGSDTESSTMAKGPGHLIKQNG
ncbi:hypothetical protein HYE11_03785 [Mycoplasmopsis bovis]|nr:hypothetical protein HYE11_03785 [Mycoplasmopsis bovis]